ncbi:MAG TPA: ATP-binding protein [Terriglobales bacterium]|nr:ATP-binding protein [Terriglobales bacterium]
MSETESSSKNTNPGAEETIPRPRKWQPQGHELSDLESQFQLRWSDITNSISAKLLLLLAVTLVVTFGILGYLNIRLHRKDLESQTLTAAERMSDVIKRSTTSYMMRNDRNALYEMMGTMANQPGVVHLRIMNPEGRVSFSTDPNEVNQMVDKSAEACYGCHAQAQPLARLNRPDRFRIFRASNKDRVLGIITPIENNVTCSTAECHAHPPNQQILGVLDTSLSLAKADADNAHGSMLMAIYTAAGSVIIAVLSFLFIWEIVHRPLKKLKRGTEHLRDGNLGYQIDVVSNDEIGELSSSFNSMSYELFVARQEITSWALTLEQRVEEKTRELRRAHEQMLQAERMVAIGKLAAVVAHEINNPLAGILTYAKLIRRWFEKGIDTDAKKKEVTESLDLIAGESRRCGDLVKNLLTFSRTSPISLEKADINSIVERCVKLIEHKAELAAIQLQSELAPDLPTVYCDAAQVEQVLLALCMNAIDAMPHGGNLWLKSARLSEAEIQLTVRDDGTGIPESVLRNLFEPFLTTKEVGKGVGLGLAISKGIVDRHGGKIEVESQPGHGTTFRITLPVDARVSEAAAVAAAGNALVH